MCMTAITYDQARKRLTSRFQNFADEEISMWITGSELLAYIDSELTEQYVPQSPYHHNISQTTLHFDEEEVKTFSPSNRTGISELAMGLYKEAGATRDILAQALAKNSEDQASRANDGATPVGGHVFRKQSNTWEIVFNGEPCDPVPDVKGMVCIRTLLENPYTKIRIAELEGISTEGISDIVAEEHGLFGTSTVSGNDNVPDDEAVKQYKAELKRIAEQISNEEQENNPDIDAIERLKNSQTQILAEVAKSSQSKFSGGRTQANSAGTTPVA
ncbi:MAG: hypothetical protein QGI68_09920, partial [Pseudomonadales bacterium]|nr:hypothetical protein [Pseudomonadales bacterium]